MEEVTSTLLPEPTKPENEPAQAQGYASAPEALARPPDPLPAHRVPVLVGGWVQYFTPRTDKQTERGGYGPYAAVITEITDAEKGMVCLRVFPAFMPSYDVANVGYADVEKPPLLDEPFEAFWRMPSFYD